MEFWMRYGQAMIWKRSKGKHLLQTGFQYLSLNRTYGIIAIIICKCNIKFNFSTRLKEKRPVQMLCFRCL